MIQNWLLNSQQKKLSFVFLLKSQKWKASKSSKGPALTQSIYKRISLVITLNIAS